MQEMVGGVVDMDMTSYTSWGKVIDCLA